MTRGKDWARRAERPAQDAQKARSRPVATRARAVERDRGHVLGEGAAPSRPEAARDAAGGGQAARNARDASMLGVRGSLPARVQDTIVQRILAAGMTLQRAAELAAEPEVHWRVEAAIDELDLVIREVRDAVFGRERRTEAGEAHQEMPSLPARLRRRPKPRGRLERPGEPALAGRRVLHDLQRLGQQVFASR